MAAAAVVLTTLVLASTVAVAVATVGIVVAWVVPVFVTHAQGKPKHRAGAVYGICLGWLGVLVLAVLPPYERPLA